MQQRRRTPFIVLAILILAIASLFGLSHVYTPKVTRHTETIELDGKAFGKTKAESSQPIEYP